MFLGRDANFIDGELCGRPTYLSLGVFFSGNAKQNCPRFAHTRVWHQTQLYEAGLEGSLLGIIILLARLMGGLKLSGLITGVFFFGYALSRFLLEFFSQSGAQLITNQNALGYSYKFGDYDFTSGPVLSIPMVINGIIFIFLKIRTSIASYNLTTGEVQ